MSTIQNDNKQHAKPTSYSNTRENNTPIVLTIDKKDDNVAISRFLLTFYFVSIRFVYTFAAQQGKKNNKYIYLWTIIDCIYSTPPCAMASKCPDVSSIRWRRFRLPSS